MNCLHLDTFTIQISTNLLRLFAISLIALVSFQTVGYLSLMLARVRKVRTEMAVLLNDDAPELEMHTITLSIADLDQTRAGEHEFYYQGDLYDIVKITPLEGDKVAVSVLRDVQEQALLAHLGLSLEHAGKPNTNNPIARFFVNILYQTYILPQASGLLPIAKVEKRKQDFTCKGLHSLFQPYVIAPPPRQV